TDEVAGAAHLIIAPHEREQRRPVSGRDLLWAGGDPLGDGPKDRRDVGGEVPQERGERLVVPVGQQAGTGLGRRLAGAWTRDPEELLGRRSEPETRPDE